MSYPQPPFTERVVLYCPAHGDRYLRTPNDTEPFPEPALCGYPLSVPGGSWRNGCEEVCTITAPPSAPPGEDGPK